MLSYINKYFDNRNILVITVGFFLLFFGFGGAHQYIVPLLEMQGRGNAGSVALLIIYSAFFLANLIAQRIIATIGLRLAMLIGATPYALFSALAPINSSFALYGASVLVGLGAALLWNSSAQIIGATSGPGRMGRNTGISQAALYIGVVLGVGTAAILLQHCDLHTVFYYFATVTALGVGVLSLMDKCEALVKPSSTSLVFLFNSKFLLLAPAVLAGSLLSALSVSSLNLLALNLGGKGLIGGVSTILKLGSAVAGLASGKFTRKFDGAKGINIIIAFGIIGTVIPITSPSFSGFAISAFCIGLSISGAYPVVLDALRQRTEAGEFAQAVSAFHIYSTFGTVVGFIAAIYLNPLSALWTALIILFSTFPFTVIFGCRFSISNKN